MSDDRVEQRRDELLTDAENAAADGDWPGAAAFARAALALDAGSGRAATLAREAEEAIRGVGERRQLTVLFADVVGSTPMLESHDPEIVREVLHEYQLICDGVVRRYEGQIARYVGDGILAYFGHPHAHEDDARRAVKAGLELCAGVGPLIRRADAEHGLGFGIRVAIHTGLVVLSDMGVPTLPDRNAIVGTTPNVAARLQDHAATGTVVISEDTHNLVRGLFATTPLGALTIRGLQNPIGAYEVIEEIERAASIDAGPATTSFVGRRAELESLLGEWDRARTGDVAAHLVVGEPGMGKSRMVEEVRRRASADGGTALAVSCSPYHPSTHFYPVRRLVQLAAGISDLSDPASVAALLRTALDLVDLGEEVAVFCDLLEIPYAAGELLQLDGAARRERMLSALTAWVRGLAADSPVLLSIDDLQWADPSTEELIRRVIDEQVPGLFVLGASRPLDEPPASFADVPRLDLARMSDAELRRMAAELPMGGGLSEGRLRSVIDRSDGVPFFFEQLIAVQGDAVDAPDAATEIPAPLHDLLLSRLGAPGVHLPTVQMLATIGREFDRELLADVLTDNPDIDSRLRGLIDAGIIEELEGGAAYRFRHHLLGNLAYETQLAPDRRARHDRVAGALLTREQHRLRDAGLAAHHLERAGRPEEAIRALIDTAAGAQVAGAHEEAIQLLGHALSLVDDIADDDVARTVELDLRRARSHSVVSLYGFGSEGAAQDFQRCLALARASQPRPDHLAGLAAAFAYHAIRSNLDAAERIASEHGQLSEAVLGFRYSTIAVGIVTQFRGNHPRAIEELEAFVAAADPEHGEPTQWALPNDASCAARAHLSLSLAIAGRSTDAYTQIDAGLARAALLDYPAGPFSRAWVRAFELIVAGLIGDIPRAFVALQDVVEIANRHGFGWYRLLGDYQTAAALSIGDPAALDSVDDAIDQCTQAGLDAWIPCFLATDAATRLTHGRLDEAIERADRSLTLAEQNGSRLYSPEALRVRGEAQVASGNLGAGLADLDRSAEVAEQQGAWLFGVRALTARCRAETSDEHGTRLRRLLASPDATTPFADAAIAHDVLDGRAAVP